MPARVVWNRALPQRLGLHREIDFGIDVGGIQGHMTEPGADRVDVDTRAQQVDGCRMPDHVRADALGGDRRDALRRLWPSSAHPIAGCSAQDRHRGARLAHILDLFAEDSRLNVYAGELEVRPPGAPTTGPDTESEAVG